MNTTYPGNIVPWLLKKSCGFECHTRHIYLSAQQVENGQILSWSSLFYLRMLFYINEQKWTGSFGVGNTAQEKQVSFTLIQQFSLGHVSPGRPINKIFTINSRSYRVRTTIDVYFTLKWKDGPCLERDGPVGTGLAIQAWGPTFRSPTLLSNANGWQVSGGDFWSLLTKQWSLISELLVQMIVFQKVRWKAIVKRHNNDFLCPSFFSVVIKSLSEKQLNLFYLTVPAYTPSQHGCQGSRCFKTPSHIRRTVKRREIKCMYVSSD